jgi:hypothetical protein
VVHSTAPAPVPRCRWTAKPAACYLSPRSDELERQRRNRPKDDRLPAPDGRGSTGILSGWKAFPDPDLTQMRTIRTRFSIGSIRIFDNSVTATRLTIARRALVTERAGRPTPWRVDLPDGLPLDTRVFPSVASALPLGTPSRGDTMETRQRDGECLLRFTPVGSARPQGREGLAPERTLTRQPPGLWWDRETDLPRSRGALEIAACPVTDTTPVQSSKAFDRFPAFGWLDGPPEPQWRPPSHGAVRRWLRCPPTGFLPS